MMLCETSQNNHPTGQSHVPEDLSDLRCINHSVNHTSVRGTATVPNEGATLQCEIKP
jgi:hypothetical protein